MGSLSKFLGSPKEIIVDGEKITIHPIKVKDMAKVTKQNPTPEEAQEIAKNLIKLSILDTTDEEVEQLPLDKYIKILEEINKLNGMGDEQFDRIRELNRKK